MFGNLLTKKSEGEKRTVEHYDCKYIDLFEMERIFFDVIIGKV
jgi:hypothetical protein